MAVAETNKAVRKTAKAKGHPDDEDVVRTVNSRSRGRQQLAEDVDAYLAEGGVVTSIDPHVTADPPTKPVSQYGGRPI